MKVNKITSQPEFQPVTLQITIESQSEYQLLLDVLRNREDIAVCVENYNVLIGEESTTLQNLMTRLWEAI